MYKIVIGIDVSKEVLDIAYSFNNETQYLMQVQNSSDGIVEFLSNIRKITRLESTDSWFVCFENTGVYSNLLLRTLLSINITCLEENAARIKAFFSLQRGKRDDWDACRICEYAIINQERLKPSKPSEHKLSKLKHLFNYRDVLVDKRRALGNAVREKHEAIGEEFMSEINEHNEEIIDLMSEKIAIIEKQMMKIIENEEKIKINYKLTTTVIGIGKIIGIAFIIKTDNFEKFPNPRTFASNVGIAPYPNQSGKSYGATRVSKKADIKMKALISNGVNAAITFDPQLKAYYERLKEKGKNPGVIRNNIKNKLVHRVFSVVQRGTPYVKLAS